MARPYGGYARLYIRRLVLSDETREMTGKINEIKHL